MTKKGNSTFLPRKSKFPRNLHGKNLIFFGNFPEKIYIFLLGYTTSRFQTRLTTLLSNTASQIPSVKCHLLYTTCKMHLLYSIPVSCHLLYITYYNNITCYIPHVNDHIVV